MRRRRSARSEDGVIAIVTAMMVVLLALSAGFVVDFGQAWIAKRQMQTAADAAALAAASAYAKTPGTCSTMLNTPANATAAKAAADAYRASNGSPDTSNIVASCDSGALQVKVTSKIDSTSVFGPLIGTSAKITVQRSATASVEVSPQTGIGMRPMAVCFAQLPSPFVTKRVYRIDYPGDGHKMFPGCPDSEAAGNWWTLDCPGERAGATSQLEAQIKDGCPDPVTIVSPQNASTPATLSASLTSACPSAPINSETCLSGDPGQMDAGQIPDSWKYLVDQQLTVVLPVFCAPATCNPTTLTGTGTNAVFPVFRLIAVQVCGYHFSKNAKDKYDKYSGDCAFNPSGYNAQTDNSKDNYLLLSFSALQTSGGTKPSGCTLGGSCDMGVRRTRLTR